jgi:hypothetical protein
LTLANGFIGSPTVTATTFAVDPNFQVGNAQNWNVSIQNNLPSAMAVTLTYLGIKGTHVPQRILPNTFPYGAVIRVTCPTGLSTSHPMATRIGTRARLKCGDGNKMVLRSARAIRLRRRSTMRDPAAVPSRKTGSISGLSVACRILIRGTSLS